MQDILIAIYSASGVTLLVLMLAAYLLLTNPEKIEKWAAILNKFISGFGGLFRSAHKKYVKYDIQSRVNSFIRQETAAAPYFEDAKVVVEWIDANLDRKGFLDNNRVILRLRRNDPEDLNFAHGAYWAISTIFLRRVKKYISSNQKQALDLYVTTSLIKREKCNIVEYFLEQYLHPLTDIDGNKVSSLYWQFDKIDKYGVFYPILLQEMYFLSRKVYGGPRDGKIITEVTKLIDFLDRVASRIIGDIGELDFKGDYCKFAIVIIGRAENVSDNPNIYVNFLQKELVPAKTETIYLLGKYEYYDFINDVSDRFQSRCTNPLYEVIKTYRHIGQLKNRKGKFEQEEYLVVLRAQGIDINQGE